MYNGRVRVLNGTSDIALKHCWGIGDEFDVIDGVLEDIEGFKWDNDGEPFKDFSELFNYFKNATSYTTIFEEVIDMKNEFKIGDIVKVIDTGKTYSTYEKWIEKYAPEYIDDYSNKSFDVPFKGDLYRVITTGKHMMYDVNLVLIQNEYSDQVYIISEDGLKLYQTKTEPNISTSKVDIHSEICQELNNIYQKKNADYGDSFSKSFNEYGLTMSCIRLEDKLSRLKALSRDGVDQKVLDESIEDTLKDLANYAIMSLIELQNNKK